MSGAQRTDVPERSRALNDLGRVDYEDAFAARLADSGVRSPEQWARAMFEEAPAGVRSGLVAAWTAIGTRLGPRPSPDHVLGWQIARLTGDACVLAAGSRVGNAARLVLLVEPGRLSFASFVTLPSRATRLLWIPTGPVHRQAVPWLLGRVADGR